MKTRREFLRNTSLIALSPLVPKFLSDAARAAGTMTDSRILVVVQLEGGNDGINTVVPFGDPAYATSRPSLRIPDHELLKIDNRVGLHPSMRGMADLLEGGRLAVVQGAGYPNPNRSHFESMRIWQTANLMEGYRQTGWIGSALDRLQTAHEERNSGPDSLYVGDEEMPVALTGLRAEMAAISSLDDLTLRLSTDGGTPSHIHSDSSENSFAIRSVLRAYGTAHDLSRSAFGGPTKNPAYPGTRLAKQLGIVSQIIKSGVSTRVYYVSQGGYDTHVAQLSQHASLLADLSSAISAFMSDLRSAGLSDRVLLMTFSEFGRRVAENGSLGTDHGAAAPVFLVGEHLRPGLHGQTPSLSDLDQGDLKVSVDFRRIYTTVLKDWLKVKPGDATLPYEALPLLK